MKPAILRNRKEIAGITLAVFDRPVDAAKLRRPTKPGNTSPYDTPFIKPSIPVDRSHSVGSYPSLRRDFVQRRKASRSDHPTSAKKRAGCGSCYRRRAGKIFGKRSPASHCAISRSPGSRTQQKQLWQVSGGSSRTSLRGLRHSGCERQLTLQCAAGGTFAFKV